MAIIKCKMCGGDLELLPDSTVCECEYCGTRQTVPSADSEKMLSLFHRAGKLLRAYEFDKAYGVYESIVNEFPDEAEAYWGLVLCSFGIEYVDDPVTGKKVPTCHRAGFESVEDDVNFEQACENADAVARRVYREEGRAIDELRERIIEVSGREEPYDIFISYKELAEDGERTEDSVLAQDIYDALTAKGYRVFFSRVTLEDKLGVEYEPYIFAALQSAKVMLLVGMDYENLNAVWVRNEWSRYLALMAQHKEKVLIPCYKNMDAYDLPKEVRKLAAQDMGKVGAMQDLLRGVEKIIPLKTAEPAAATQVVMPGGPNVTALQKRGIMALEDGQWDAAKNFFNQVLNMDAENAEAWLGLAMADIRLRRESGFCKLRDGQKPVEHNTNYQKFLRFAVPERAQQIKEKLTAAEQLKEEREEAERKAKAEREAEEKRRKEQELGKLEQIVRDTLEFRNRVQEYQGMISAGQDYTIGVRSDGTVVITGTNEKELLKAEAWKNIVAVAARRRVLGLRADGTAVSHGNVFDKEYSDVYAWRDVIAIAAGNSHAAGLRKDGSVLIAGHANNKNHEASSWRNIVSVATGDNHTVGLMADGRVVACGDNSSGQCNVSHWKDIEAIAANGDYTIGLKKSGTVVVTGNFSGDVSNWQGIAFISAGLFHAVGLQFDGTAVATGWNMNNQCEITDWTDLVAVAAGNAHTVGLRSDGLLISTRKNHNAVKLFGSFDPEISETMQCDAEAARKEAQAQTEAIKDERKLASKNRISELQKERETLRLELSELKGLFTGKRRKEIEARLGEISDELKSLAAD